MKSNQNQIDMMSGALANNIQVIRVQGQFSDVESGIKQNSNSIKDINRALIIQKERSSSPHKFQIQYY